MKKLSLDLNELRVESFEAMAEPDVHGGTVEAYGTYDGDTCFGPSCRRCPSANCTADCATAVC